MRLIPSKLYEATIKRADGGTFTLSSNSREGIKELLAMWQQPLETWNGEFKTHTQLAQSQETTVSVTLDMEVAS